MTYPLLTAHTGCMGTPDNSLFSIETALSSGADIVEEDILVTSDGVLVLSHDDSVYAADGKAYRISSMSYAELSQLDINAHNGAPGETMRILSLESVLPLLRASGKIMNLDLKSDDCVEPVARFVENNGLHEKVILSGCETSRAHAVNRTDSRLRKLLNVDTSLFLALNEREAARISCEDASSANCFGLNVNYRVVGPELLQAAANHKLDVYIWTVNAEEEMKHFMEMGVHSITSRNIAALVQVRKEVSG
ncbi:glycerophosphodiester phosphodiesterase family protein [Paenibacillus qinlingensis]|uniref:Glycerophosphoryl diester phosphodiesterase n=1 Tax=Paenibacillus qinlingensis TaxID=1837343 RepID=A0ABU1NW39_9BACL|nr:glycerophosphodiester phosphodiesterase family protein [Paenibacillus qinlingensis]MDR6551694.1 glycerophosphoryl diester phosphodiesterase [Paenibacillus qinlingensis]